MNARIRLSRCAIMPRSSGEVAEWSIVPDSKSGVLQGTEGSNPSLSAKEKHETRSAQASAGFLLSVSLSRLSRGLPMQGAALDQLPRRYPFMTLLC